MEEKKTMTLLIAVLVGHLFPIDAQAQSSRGGQGYNPGVSDDEPFGGERDSRLPLLRFAQEQRGGQGYNAGRGDVHDGVRAERLLPPNFQDDRRGGQGYNPGADIYFPSSPSFEQGYTPDRDNGYNLYDVSENNLDRDNNCFDSTMFTVIRAAEISRDGSGRLRFARTISNIGGGWDSGRSEFVAPDSGSYTFSWAALSPASEPLRLDLLHNDIEIMSSWGDSAGYQTAAGQANLNLRRGDRVHLEVGDGRIYEPYSTDRGYATFSGHRIG